jgi:hypothetical protein
MNPVASKRLSLEDMFLLNTARRCYESSFPPPPPLLQAVQTTARARTLDVTRRPCYSTRSIIHSPADELHGHGTPNEVELLWENCQLLFLLLSKLFLRLKQSCKWLHFHYTASEGVSSFFKRSYIHYRM